MEIIILGTGTSQGIPVIGCNCFVCNSTDSRDKRLRTAALIKTRDASLVIDAGPDFRQQMLRIQNGVLDAILITHAHKDHVGGLDDVRAYNWLQKKPMDVYAGIESKEAVMRELPYAFEEDKYPGVPRINLLSIPEQDFLINRTRVTPFFAMHGQMPVTGFRVGDFSYLTDANYIEDKELEKMKGSRFMVLNALRKEKHHSHFSLAEAIDIVNKISPEMAWFTHISHQLGRHAEVETELPANIRLAYDGLRIAM